MMGSVLAEAEQAGGVVLEDLGPNLRLDVEQFEVAQPALGGEQRIVGAEQHLVLQVGVGRADQRGREVLRRPAGQVDPPPAVLKYCADAASSSSSRESRPCPSDSTWTCTSIPRSAETSMPGIHPPFAEYARTQQDYRIDR
jgi:hypothetical protein